MSSAMDNESAEGQRKEERWIESEFLQRPNKKNNDEDEVEDENDDICALFADPDPMDTFDFRWTLDNSEIHVSLTGYKAELGQTLHSTGLTLWRASPAMCDFLVKNAADYIEGKHVLELGAGLGLCGIVAHHLQARSVLLTDGDTDSLNFLRQNVASNCVATDAKVAVQQLIWGRTHAEHLGWEHCDGNKTFDTILGSDIIYVEEILNPLFETVDSLLSPNGKFLLAYARRNVKIDLVLSVATEYGLQWTCPESAEGVYIFTRNKVV